MRTQGYEYRTTPEVFKKTVQTWAIRIGVAPSGIYLQRMTSKWGSCSSNGRICFALDLLLESREFQNLAIVHELLHLQIPNHGKLFKSLLSAYLPGWELLKSQSSRAFCSTGTASDLRS